MSGVQILIMAILSAIVTLPTVTLIPRARQSPAFDRVLWAATWLLAFLGAWYAVGNIKNDSQLTTSSILNFAQETVLPMLVGAVVGALSLNALLCLMDRFAPPISEQVTEDQAPVSEDAVEEEHGRKDPE